MFETLLTKIVDIIINGGQHAIDFILFAIILILIHERNRLIKEINKKEEKIDKIIEDYYEGNLTLSEALNSLKLVLYEIKGRIL